MFLKVGGGEKFAAACPERHCAGTFVFTGTWYAECRGMRKERVAEVLSHAVPPLLPRISPPFPVTLPTFLVNAPHEFLGRLFLLFPLFLLWAGLDHYRVLLWLNDTNQNYLRWPLQMNRAL